MLSGGSVRMGKLTNWLSANSVLEPLFDVVGKEVDYTLMEVANNVNNYSAQDQLRLSQDLGILKTSFTALAKFSVKKDSIKGETAFPSVYGGKQKRVDVLTHCRSGQFRFTECKFGIKPGGVRPFSDANEFKAKVAKKFDQDQHLATRDKEVVWQVRIVVVEDGHFDQCLSAIRILERTFNTPGHCSTDGMKHYYALCKCSSLRKLLDAPSAPKPITGELQYFCV